MSIKYVKWSDYPVGRKYKVWDMLEKIGDEIVVVTGNGLNKHGVSLSAGKFGAATGRVLSVVYTSKNMIKVRFERCV